MELTLEKESVTDNISVQEAIQKETISKKSNRLEFFSGCLYILKKLFLLG